MEALKSYADSIPLIKLLSKKSQVQPEYVLIFTVAVSVVLIQTSALGQLLSNTLSLMMPIRDVLLVLGSPNATLLEYRRHLIVLALFSMFILIESSGVGRMIPLFFLFKAVVMLWAGFSENNANVVYDLLLSKVPLQCLQLGDGIEAAVKKAAKAVDENVSIKNVNASSKK
jgi:hypothetical protein